MRVYVAGPMRGRREFNFPAFDRAAAVLRAVGYEVVSPAELDRELGFDPTGLLGDESELRARGFDVADAMRRDIEEILTCDGVVLLEGWSRSRGATFERELALQIGLPTRILPRALLDGPTWGGSTAPREVAGS